MKLWRWWLSALWLSGLASSTIMPSQIRIAAIFDEEQDKKHELAFRYGVERINKDPSILPGKRLEAEIIRVPEGNSFAAERETCALLQKGVAAIFGPQSSASADHIHSIVDSVEVPFLDTRWSFKTKADLVAAAEDDEYLINLHPDVTTLSNAYSDLIAHYGWETITILYEDNDSMMRLKGILDKTSESMGFRLVVKELKKTEENGFRDVLKEVYSSRATMLILDCGREIISDVLKQAQQVGLMSEEYYYLLTTLDAHTVDLEDFKYSGTNFTAFRLIETSRGEVQAVVRSIVKNEMNQGRIFDFQNGNLDTNTALIYDAVHLFALSLHELSQIQEITITPLDCSGQNSWVHGTSLVNYMKLTEFTGLSGHVSFDTQGLRSEFLLELLELQSTGLESIGTWNPVDMLNLTRAVEVTEESNPVNIMANKTFKVTLILNAPYTMLKEESKRLEGNDRFEGYAIDLMDEIANLLHFNVTYQIVNDEKYGSQDEHGNWDGVMREVIDGPDEENGADFAVADLSITSSRAGAVTFSMPFMNLGISIIYIKPREAPPSMLSFLMPFTVEVWMYTLFGYVLVSLVTFIIARFSPYEWDNPYPCIEDPDELENQFSLANSFWFTIGTLMQQGSDVAPRSLSTRLLAGMWYFFAMIVIASYTANLAAFLTVETLEKPIESADDLAAQTDISYGVLKGGSTENFFRTSTMEPFMTMWNFMDAHSSDVMVHSNHDGIEKVLEADGKYAYLMESSSIQYIIERDCQLTQIGGNLDSKGYGIPMHNTMYKSLVDSAILELQEGGVLHNLYTRWWKQKRGGGACLEEGGEGSGVAELEIPNVAGVFLVTVAGYAIATILCVFEFFYGTKQKADEAGITWWEAIKEDFQFAILCHGTTRTLRKPLSNESSRNESVSGSHAGSELSLENAPTSAGSPADGRREGSGQPSSNRTPQEDSIHYEEAGSRRAAPPNNHYGRSGRNPFE